MTFSLRWFAFLPLALLLWSADAAALVPVSYRSTSGETWEQVAAIHGVQTETLRAENPGLSDPGSGWVRLPAGVGPRRTPAVALLASGYKEIEYVVKDSRIDGVYRIVGREFHVGAWNGVRIVAGVAGGNMNNAAIGATILFHHFDVRVMGFVGIAGGSGTTRVGDVLVASGAVQHDQGNWWDFELPRGDVFAGLTWHMRGAGIISDAKRESRLVLTPSEELLTRLRRAVAGVELPQINADVAAFHRVERYRPAVLLDGWSASGAQFVTSHHARATIERRIALAAERAGLPPPRHFVVDQEDFAAVQAAEEHGVPWFITRIVVDLAAQRNAGVGIPLALYDRPEEIPAWLARNSQESHSKNFNYSWFYRQLAHVLAAIVQELASFRSN
jgi:nucleoside phosphorylase